MSNEVNRSFAPEEPFSLINFYREKPTQKYFRDIFFEKK